MLRTLLILLALCWSGAVRAEWREAASRNFRVYSSGGEAQLREFTARLEKLHFVLRTAHNVTAPPSPVPLRVFLMSSGAEVSDVSGIGGILGYYESRARHPIVVGTRWRGSGNGVELDGETVLQHEYAHHFMFNYFPATYPTWYVEGFAEFWSTTRFLDRDVVEVGHPAQYRLQSFWAGQNRWLPIRNILSARSYGDIAGDVDLIYAEGWLLLRYLFDNRARNGQLQRYLAAINAGRSYEEAMDEAFGPGARALDSELFAFAGQHRFNVVRLPFRPIDTGPIEIRRLTPSEEALIRQEIALDTGVPQREAAEFARRVREIAGRFPDDPYALATLTEAERLAGNDAAALAAAERLLALQPNHPRGIMYRAMLQVKALQDARSADAAAWRRPRADLVRAIRLAPSDPLILEAYYDSFIAQGVLPPAGAQNGLYEALNLAPGDQRLRHKLAADFEQRDMIDEAIAIIRPLAYAMPHRGSESGAERQRRERERQRSALAGQPLTETAREMLDRLERKRAERAARPGG